MPQVEHKGFPSRQPRQAYRKTTFVEKRYEEYRRVVLLDPKLNTRVALGWLSIGSPRSHMSVRLVDDRSNFLGVGPRVLLIEFD